MLRAALGAMALLLAVPAFAGPLLQDLADRSLKCAIDPAYYVSPKSESLTTLRWADGEGQPWEDLTVPLAAPVLTLSQPDRFEVVLAGTPTHAKAEHLAFIRTKERDPATRKLRTVISLHMDGDTVGDECFVEKGRKAYVENRFNTVREFECGNDPAPSCERLLEKTCGPEPTFACATGARPALAKATKAYFDKLNARAGQPVR